MRSFTITIKITIGFTATRASYFTRFSHYKNYDSGIGYLDLIISAK